MPQPDAKPARSRVRRRLAFALIALAAILLLVITPPLVNIDRYRHRIVRTMSDSLGRPVHIDAVKLRLLPWPSLELRNVVVSEDPAFGFEPTIRANRVLAILRPSSLWRRRIEFSTIRFAADENGSGPSVNLVRNPAGRWNLDSVLMQAAHVPTAPTDQPKAGPAPRFPYIEATSARVNLKLGNEKMPFSLTDAEFALWLPSPDEWRVRLKAHPTRTDRSLSETGNVQLEGTLRRAGSMAQVPVDLKGVWNGAQLGEATALLTGQDMGWRGTGDLILALRGPLANAALTTTLNLHDLRRAEFVPARSLDLTVTCQAQATVTEAVLLAPACTLPAPLPEGPGYQAGQEGTGKLALQATRLDLTSGAAADLRFSARASDAWLLDWARLFSSTIPADQNPTGLVQGTLTRIPAAANQPGFWNGQLEGAVTGTLPWHKPGEGGSAYSFLLQASPEGFELQPVNLALSFENPLSLRGSFDRDGYSLHLLGLASAPQVYSLARLMPPFSTGLSTVLPPPAEAQTSPAQHIDLTCARPWSAPEQTCSSTRQAEPAPHPRPHARHRR